MLLDDLGEKPRPFPVGVEEVGLGVPITETDWARASRMVTK